MIRTLILLGALVAHAAGAQAQQVKPELRPFAGWVVPTGDLRERFMDAPMAGVAAALELKPSLHVLGTFAWIAAQNKYGVAENNVNIYQYSIGAELGFVQPLIGRWEMRPFAGLGFGMRTYLYQALSLRDRTCALGYGTLGAEFQIERTALRLEARDHLVRFRSPLMAARATTYNDIGLSLGIAYHLR